MCCSHAFVLFVVGVVCFFFFFFQAEDGIRDLIVTGVQTCALPIYTGRAVVRSAWNSSPRVTAKRAARAARQRRLNCGIASRSARCRRARRSGGRGVGRGACRGRGEVSGVAVSLKKKKKKEGVRRWM